MIPKNSVLLFAAVVSDLNFLNESGKETFWQRMTREITHIKTLYPEAMYVGIADGANKNNWSFLKEHTEKQTLDFYHEPIPLIGISSIIPK